MKEFIKPNYEIADLLQPERLSEIIHRLGHDIGNPLTSIISFASVLERLSADGMIDDRASSYITSISKEAWRLSLINDRMVMLLSHKKNFGDSCTLGDAIDAALRRLKQRHEISSLLLSIDDLSRDLCIPTDPEQLTALFVELLLNTYPHQQLGPATITSLEHTLGFEIKNPIASLPTTPLAELFLPFVSYPQDHRHTGLGLAIAYAICIRMHATIAIAIDTDNFIVRCEFPELSARQNSSTTSDLPITASKALPERIHLLLVEDDHTVSSAIQKVLGFLLKNQTKLEITVATGSNVLEILAENEIFHAVFCDLNLSDVSGKVIFERVKQLRPELITHFGFITGDRGKAQSISYLEATGRPFLFKPFEPEDLVDFLYSLIV